jgi:hypothetical protein
MQARGAPFCGNCLHRTATIASTRHTFRWQPSRLMTSLCDRVALFFSIVAEIMFIDDVDEHDLALRAQHSQRRHRAQFKVFIMETI